jgi:hypothetical protein
MALVCCRHVEGVRGQLACRNALLNSPGRDTHRPGNVTHSEKFRDSLLCISPLRIHVTTYTTGFLKIFSKPVYERITEKPNESAQK